jgi:hypothetical protein
MVAGAKPGERRGGRPAGTPNKITAVTRERIAQEADPIGFLTRIMNGEAIKVAATKETGEVSEIVPTLDQRMSAGRVLADKGVPNAKPAMRRIVLPLPTVEKATDALVAHDAILAAMPRFVARSTQHCRVPVQTRCPASKASYAAVGCCPL